MSAPEQPQGVRLRYAGGEVYAAPTADRHVWRVAGVEVHVDMVASLDGAVIGATTPHDLGYAVEITARVAAERARRESEAAESAKPAPVAKRTTKAKGRGRR